MKSGNKKSGLKVAWKEEQKVLIPIMKEIKKRDRLSNITIAITWIVFLQTVIVCMCHVPLIVGYTGLFISIAISSYCNGRKDASHEMVMELWAQLKT